MSTEEALDDKTQRELAALYPYVDIEAVKESEDVDVMRGGLLVMLCYRLEEMEKNE